ncbi:MAG: transcriptional repressor LexA [Steroidobacteraceae bacterium]
MDSPPPLSARQQQILQQIAQFMAQQKRPPTRADLARALGLRNRQGIDQHLRVLERKGYLQLEPGIARGIRLLQSEESPPQTSPPQTSPRAMLLPLYGRVAAGLPALAEGNIEEQIALDRTLFRPRADFLLRVHGQSMRDAGIADRDILAVHRTAQALNGQIVVARLGDEATVKFYRRRGTMLRLEPANPDFTPIEIDLRTQPWRIEGIVVGILRTDLSGQIRP